MATQDFFLRPRTWRVAPDNVAEFCSQVNEFAEAHYHDMERIRELLLAGEAQVAYDVVHSLEKIAKLIGIRRLTRLLSELRLHCSGPNWNQSKVTSLISICEMELAGLKKLAVPKGELTKLKVSS